jgi:glucosamine-6-phosphate deaminase
MGAEAARTGADRMRETLERTGAATILLATGASQFDLLDALVREDVDWPRVTVFHLDEYIGLPRTHPASFRRYLQERFVDRLPHPVRRFHFIEADEAPEKECARLAALIEPVTVDVAFIGIGENGHLASTIPPPTSTPNALPDGRSRRGMPTSAAGRGVVRHARRCAAPGPSPCPFVA